MENNLKLLDFSLRINDKIIFQNINFEFKQSSINLIKGKSGSGKSCLLESICGIIPNLKTGKISGKVLLNNKDITKSSVGSLSGELGYMMQDPDSQLCTFCVEDEIVFGLENLQCPTHEMEKKLNDVLKFCDIEYLRYRNLNELSGGQKQLVALASILILNPDVLLLDEPTANLDTEYAKLVIDIIEKLAKDLNKIVVLVEHNYGYLFNKIDSIYDIESNSYIDKGIDSLLQNYIDNYKLTKVSSAPMDNVVLKAEDLEFSYGDKKILDKINFNLKKGEILGLVGRNGEGKTTLASIIAGLKEPTNGKIIIDNVNLSTIKKDELGNFVGLVFQNPEHQFVKYTVEDELRLGLDVRKLKKR